MPDHGRPEKSKLSEQERPHRKTCRRYDVSGHAHAITFSCFQQQPFLSRDRSRQWTLDALDRARETHGFDLWAYVLMPEHVHLLIYPGDAPALLSHILKTLKQSVTNRALAFCRLHAPEFLPRMLDRQPSGEEHYRFWQRGGGFDRNLWKPLAIWEIIDYIHANPVRRELCGHPTDWPWSSARAYEDRTAGPLRIDFDSLPDDPRPPGRV